MKVVWTPRARADLFEIHAYLTEHSPVGAERVVTRILERVSAQTHLPFAAPIEREGPERCLVITQTNYLVLYDISGDELRVVAVVHASQHR